MDKESVGFVARTLRERRNQLCDEVDRAESGLREIGENREGEADERASDERQTQLLSHLDERARQEISEIDAALRRIDEGRYGSCASCGRRIDVERLRALPTSVRCAACAAELERAGSHSQRSDSWSQRRRGHIPVP